MNYNSTLLTTVADCDLLLNKANKDKKALERRKTTLEWKIETFEDNSVVIEADMLVISMEIEAQDRLIATLPDGPRKNDAANEKRKLEHKMFLLTERKSGIVLLEIHYDIDCIEREIEATVAFIDVIKARRDEL